MKHHIYTQNQQGYLLILVLVFGAVFFMIASSFTVFIITQSRLVTQKVQVESAGLIAESGLEYYKWFLAHFPNDLTNGTGVSGPYVGVQNDPEGGPIGSYSLTVATTSYCGDTVAIDVTSVGSTYAAPNVKRTMTARYARPTVAEYSYILNSDVWVGSDAQIIGPYHSNSGVRMDGRHNSVITSGQSTWSCTPAFGCTPTSTRSGVFTTTANATPSLFEFPSPPINFAGITVDLANILDKAKNRGGRYIPPSTKQGYHIIFAADGTYEVRRVNGKQNEPNGFAWGQQMNILNGTTFVGTYPISVTCPVIFVEDQVWLEGVGVFAPAFSMQAGPCRVSSLFYLWPTCG